MYLVKINACNYRLARNFVFSNILFISVCGMTSSTCYLYLLEPYSKESTLVGGNEYHSVGNTNDRLPSFIFYRNLNSAHWHPSLLLKIQ